MSEVTEQILGAIERHVSEALERCELASDGPWEAERSTDVNAFDGQFVVSFPRGTGSSDELSEHDARFVAESRWDVPQFADSLRMLVAEVRRLRAMLRATTRQQDEQIRVLREALRRAVHHLGSAAPVNDEESLVAMDDFHAAKMLVGRTDDAWDDAAAERGMRSIRREALGTDDEAAR